MINWRGPLILPGLRLLGSDIPRNLRTIHKLSHADSETVARYQTTQLKRMLRHAHRTVPYYREVLEEAGVVAGGEVTLEHFTEIPLLTKETLRKQGDRLLSSEPGPDPYKNTSGGTTGEPVRFVQDQHYWEWNVANKLFYQGLAGKPLGGREVKLWGSERDILEGRDSLKTRAIEYLYNRRSLNSFKMGEEEMRDYVGVLNSFRPHTVWAYVESMRQLAEFVKRQDLLVHSPEGIVTTAGTLHRPVRETIEEVFETTVHDQYGSREVGDMACECAEQEGMHVFPHTHYIEVAPDDGQPLGAGVEGNVIVTSLTNYSMPLVRYKIGDMAIRRDDDCPCGRSFPLLETVTGRVTDHFVTREGELVHGEYFTHLFYGMDEVRRFRVVQESVDGVRVLVETDDGERIDRRQEAQLREGIMAVLGADVSVAFDTHERLSPADSGKFRYTISEVTR